MSLNLTTWQKVKTVSGFLVVFFLVFATNMMDKHHFTIVQDSYSKVYTEKFAAKDYIYRMSRLIQDHRGRLIEYNPDDSNVASYSFGDSLNLLISKYKETKLTKDEARIFESMKSKCQSLIQSSQNVNTDSTSSLSSQEPLKLISKIELDLDNLARIQMEGIRREASLASRIVDQSDFMYKLEIGALLIIGLIIQLILFVKPWK